MRVEFRVFANLRDILDIKIKIISISEKSTICDLLLKIKNEERNGELFYSTIVDTSTHLLKPYVKIILNGKILFSEVALFTNITEDLSVVAIFPPIGGG